MFQSDAFSLGYRKEASLHHRILTNEELAIFRTHLCEAQCRGFCKNPDRCSSSHCLTWQRRNPLKVFYSPTLCPDIEFVRCNAKMALIRKCTRGRTCPYAHSKEEELYHPMVYKTKLCKSFPQCRRFYCPFAHNPIQLRKRLSANEYRSLAVPKPATAFPRSARPQSPTSSLLTTEATSSGQFFNSPLPPTTRQRSLAKACGARTAPCIDVASSPYKTNNNNDYFNVNQNGNDNQNLKGSDNWLSSLPMRLANRTTSDANVLRVIEDENDDDEYDNLWNEITNAFCST